MNALPPHHPFPQIDGEAIRAFVEVVYDRLEGYVALRQIGERGSIAKTAFSSYPSVADLAAECSRLAPEAASSSRGLFALPATVASPGSAKAAEIDATRVVLVDLDSGDIGSKRRHLEQHLGEPTLVVASGGITAEGQSKLHLYWQLTEPAVGDDLTVVAQARREIARKCGGDPAFASLHQPVRVPGSIHMKHGRPAPVRLLTRSEASYPLAVLVAAIEAMPLAPGVEVPSAKAAKPSVGDVLTQKTRQGGVDGITRFDAISMVIGHWLRIVRTRSFDLDEAWQAVREYNQAMIVPPWAEDALRREFNALLAKDRAGHSAVRLPDAPTQGRDGALVVPLSEDDLACRLVSACRGQWRYVGAWDRWMHWSGVVWQADMTDGMLDLARRICREAAPCDGSQLARRISARKTHDAVARIARTDPDIAAAPDIWDRHPMLLNTPAGVVDLLTGTLTSHEPDLLLTQITASSPGSICPRWERFLDEITDGDSDLQAYLQRFFGYCLTGSTREHAFLFLHGPGANGKSVLLQTVAGVLGDYARTAAAETFLETRGDRHSTDLAGLRGARLVVVNETEHGKGWAEARLKAITGGDSVRARFMHRDFFEFVPQFKVAVAGNHRPALRTVGEAMRRRLHLVQLDTIIAPERRDPELVASLLSERDGILGWMIEGCLQWQRTGLKPPDRIREAVEEYLRDEDLLGQWIEESCETGQSQVETSQALFTSWSSWASVRGFEPGNLKTLGLALRARGYQAIRYKGARAWRGLRVQGEG